MCGLVAVLAPGRGPSGRLREIVGNMVESLRHRGPDAYGVWDDATSGVVLGHRRLSVLDTTTAGSQPMVSSDGRLTLVFNGEIYNYGSLKEELSQNGLRFSGHSDTEVLVAACHRWGFADALSRLVGMFSIACWDGHEKVLHLARDRMGEKPLYYGWLADGSFTVASELKALRLHPGFSPEVDRTGLAQYLRFGCLPGRSTIWKGVFKLPPGCRLAIRADSLAERPEPIVWWSITEAARQGTSGRQLTDLSAATDELDGLLRRVVTGQLVADVPVGAFLSGGVDSSTVVAIMQALSPRPVKTFTIGFRERAYDEAGHALEVARHLGTEHTELYVTPDEARAVIPLLPTIYDEPFADSSQIPTFLVSQLARRHVAVALSGDGGDELFGGYHRHFLMRSLWRRIGMLPIPLRRGLGAVLTSVSPDWWDCLLAPIRWVLPAYLGHHQAGNKVHKLARILCAGSPEEIYRLLVSYWDVPLVLGRAEPARPVAQSDLLSGLGLVERMMLLDQLGYLPDDILVKVDRAAMAVSLETRVPLLDHRLVEFSWRLAPDLKVSGGIGKHLLRQVLDRYVPRRLIDRPKMGFAIPIGEWLRGPLREWAESLLAEDRLRREGFLDPMPIRETWAQHLSGRRNWQYRLWSVLMFQAWLEAQRVV